MTTISPTRVSMYDFLYQDTLPIVSLLADAAQLSLPQTELALSASLQAIVSTLLSYQQRHQDQAFGKKLFERGAVKELRQYNAMNFATIKAILYHRSDVANTIFADSAVVTAASTYIATQINASPSQVQILLTALCVIVLRELTILIDYSQLDNDELNKWFVLQPQFLSAARFATDQYVTVIDNSKRNTANKSTINTTADEKLLAVPKSINPEAVNSKSFDEEGFDKETSIQLDLKGTKLEDDRIEEANVTAIILPPFDPYWYELTQFTPANDASIQDMQQATSDYLKAIGRSAENVQEGRYNDMLVFAPIPAIALPHQRWLLQLAKISDIYLSRNRLRITSEPISPPTRPLVNLRLIGNKNDNTPKTPNETTIKKDKTYPIWKNPIILIIILVIGSLSALAALKYQTQKSSGAIPATKAVLEQDHAKKRARQQADAAKANDSNEKKAAE